MRNFLVNHHYDTALQFADYFDDQYKPYLYVLYKKLQEGHICIRRESMESEIDRDLFPAFSGDLTNELTVESGQLVIESEGNLYLHRFFQYETKIIEKIREFLTRKPDKSQKLNLPPLKFDDGSVNWQSVALLVAIVHPFAIITGGPGTGKTTTVAKILAQFIANDPATRIGLAAPTGKAAARMAESLQNASDQFSDGIKIVFNSLQPLTIHRMLGPVKGSVYFRHNKENPLPLDVLIVDECSMIDVALFSKLLDAVGDHTRLILLGDRNQLASVEAGSLFGDFCEVAGPLDQFSKAMISTLEKMTTEKDGIQEQSNPTPLADHIIELQKSYRFSNEKGIGRLSQAVIQQNEQELKNFFSKNDEEIIIDTQYQSKVFEDFVGKFYDYLDEKDIATALKKFNQCKVLCAMRDGVYGLYNTNLRIEKLLEEKGRILRQHDYYEHRPVMITKNNYQLRLFNGDTGITRKDESGKLKVWFEINDELVGYAPSLISNADTAYAITIHKSQGSEFNDVLILLPGTDMPLLTRELVYTAITRARNHVTIQTSENTLMSAVQKSVERGSGIKYRLR